MLQYHHYYPCLDKTSFRLRQRKKVGIYCSMGLVLERRNEVVVCPHLNVSPLRKLFLTVYPIDMRRYMM